MENRTMIKNTKIYDVTGGRAFFGDVLIEGDKIKRIGRYLREENCEVVDGTGKILTPGFINCHSHSELQPFVNPQMYQVI